MKYFIATLSLAATLVFFVGAASAACVTINHQDSWLKLDNKTLVIFRGDMASALIRTPFCYISENSEVNISKESVCVGDLIKVDSKKCEVMQAIQLK